MTNFSDGDFPGFIKRAFKKQGYTKPTPIQSHVWPIAFKGRDIVGVAQTGSGKTLAFGLPAILHICEEKHKIRNVEPTVLVLAPTRELVQQINTVFNEILVGSRITNACVFGGASKEAQLYNLEKGFNILIATPGRLIDFIETRRLSLKGCTFLVLDEADRMLDMGFEPQIRTILEEITTERQTLMFSATWPDEVRSLAEEFLSNYVQINVGGMQLSANHNIKQNVEVLEDQEKDGRLRELLNKIMDEPESKTLIFASTKARVADLYSDLKDEGFPVISMHGNKSQSDREYALSQFRSGMRPVLVATDVAARGLDVDDIKYVINMDYPNTSEDYIHRIGRTARSNNSGTAYTFFTLGNMKQAKDLVEILTEADQHIEPGLYYLAEMSKSFKCGKGYSGMGSHYEVNESKPKKNNYRKKGQDYSQSNYRSRDRDYSKSWGHDYYKGRDRDYSKSWGHDNYKSRDRDYSKSWGRDSYKSRDSDGKNWDRGNKNRSHDDYDYKRKWNRDDYKNDDYDSERNWHRDEYKNKSRDNKRNWNQDDDDKNRDRDYRDVNVDKYPKRPGHYDKKSSPRQKKSRPYDSSKDSELLLQYSH